jgi:hypothetical protein
VDSDQWSVILSRGEEGGRLGIMDSRLWKGLRNLARALSGLGGVWAAGVISGVLGLVISFSLRDLAPARPLGDPLPLTLSIAQVTRGFIYFPWRPLIVHLVFALLLGILSFTILWTISREESGPDQAAKAGRIAAGINLIVVAALAVDAAVVGFYYLIAGLASIIITGSSARLAAALWARKRKRLKDEG